MPSHLTGFVCPTVSMVTTGHATGVEKTLLSDHSVLYDCSNLRLIANQRRLPPRLTQSKAMSRQRHVYNMYPVYVIDTLPFLVHQNVFEK